MNVVSARKWLAKLPPQARTAALVIAASVLLAVSIVVFNLVSSSAASVRNTARMEPAIARLLGYQASEDQLEVALADAGNRLSEVAYDSAEDASKAGAELQQVLRNFAADAGAIVGGSQLATGVMDGDTSLEDGESDPMFETLSVELSLEAPPVALDTFLSSVQSHRPRLAVQILEIQQPRQSRRQEQKGDPAALNIRMSIVALKVAAL